MSLMTAIAYREPSPTLHPNLFESFQIERPKATGSDILVAVRAISMNPVDTKIRSSAKPSDLFRILGWDASGVVVEVGSDVSLFKVGDEVYYAGALDRAGSNAQFQLVDEKIVAHKPRTLSFADAAALPLTGITAWEALFDRLEIQRAVLGVSKAVLLIVGGAGGVGSMAIQLARSVPDLTIVATASRPESIKWCYELGAHHVINHSESLSEQLSKLNIQPSLVLSTTHTDLHFENIISLMTPQGRFCLIDDPKPQLMDIGKLKRKSISLHWEFMFTRSLMKTNDMIEQHHLLTKIADLVDQGLIKSTKNEIISPINAQNILLAHSKIETHRTIGKIVLENWPIDLI